MAWYAATCGMTSLSFYQGTGKPKSIGLLDLQTPNLLEKILITAGIILSLKLKTKRTEVYVCGIINTNIKQIY